MPHAMDHSTHTYISVSLANNSQSFSEPGALCLVHPSMEYHGQVGALSDVHLYSVPKQDWTSNSEYILHHLQQKDGVVHVDVQVPRQRVRRGEEEL